MYGISHCLSNHRTGRLNWTCFKTNSLDKIRYLTKSIMKMCSKFRKLTSERIYFNKNQSPVVHWDILGYVQGNGIISLAYIWRALHLVLIMLCYVLFCFSSQNSWFYNKYWKVPDFKKKSHCFWRPNITDLISIDFLKIKQATSVLRSFYLISNSFPIADVLSGVPWVKGEINSLLNTLR